MNQPWSFLALDFLPNLFVVNGQSTFVESLVVLLHLSSFNKSAVASFLFLYKGKSVSKIMCREGFAVPYFGGNKAKLKAKHMKTRRKLIKAGTVQGDIEEIGILCISF